MNILITGATSGIGLQLALDYAAAGHSVCAVGRSQKALQQLSDKGLKTIQIDLLDREQTLAAFAALDSIDLAILSAGSCEYINMPDFDSALIDRIMRLNVNTMAHSIEAVLPALRRSSKARLVAIGSSAAYVPLPRAEAYGASKAAVAYVIKTLRVTLAPEGIGVSLVCPGFVKTPLTDRNDFPMPMLIDVETASAAIRKGIARGKAEIHFPRPFTWTLKMCSLLPQSLWATIAGRMIKK